MNVKFDLADRDSLQRSYRSAVRAYADNPCDTTAEILEEATRALRRHRAIATWRSDKVDFHARPSEEAETVS
jgi:hypothetical protein